MSSCGSMAFIPSFYSLSILVTSEVVQGHERWACQPGEGIHGSQQLQTRREDAKYVYILCITSFIYFYGRGQPYM
eukprot:scaffold11777_cov22-Tisochrysis_lutea.AAC.1